MKFRYRIELSLTRPGPSWTNEELRRFQDTLEEVGDPNFTFTEYPSGELGIMAFYWGNQASSVLAQFLNDYDNARSKTGLAFSGNFDITVERRD